MHRPTLCRFTVHVSDAQQARQSSILAPETGVVTPVCLHKASTQRLGNIMSGHIESVDATGTKQINRSTSLKY